MNDDMLHSPEDGWSLFTGQSRPASPETESLDFDQLFDRNVLQRLQDEFAAVTGVASIITRPDGTPITRPSRFTRLCSEIVRKTEIGCANCYKSDAILGEPNSTGPTIQPCLSGGLWDAGASLTPGGHHVANWLIGQVRDETQTDEAMCAYARTIGADEAAVLNAFHEVPSMSKERFKQMAQFLFTLARQLSDSAYLNLKLARSIEERNRTATTTAEERRLLRTLIDNLPNAIYVKDVQYRKMLANKADLVNMGRTSEQEILGKTDFDVFPEETARRFFTDDRHVIEEGRAVIDREESFVDRNGHTHWLLTSKLPLYDEHHAITGLLGIGHDITQRRQAEQALRDSETLYHSFVEHIPAGVFRKDSAGRYNFVNSRFCLLMGLNPDEILGKTAHELAVYESTADHPAAGRRHAELNEQGEDHHAEIMRTGKIIEVEESYVRPDGSIRYLQVVKSPVFSSDATIIGTQGIQIDITEHKHMEHQLMQAQKLEGIGTLAGGIAHEFNNLLAMILGSAELLQPQLRDQPKLKKYIDRIIETSERGSAISRQLLIFSRPDQSKMKPISLSHIVRGLEQMLVHFLPRSIAVRTMINVDNGIIMGDAGQIHQAVLNLAINAGDAMPDGGTLVISECKAEPERIRQKFGPHPNECYVAVSVSDTGIGMDASTQQKIFDPFFSTKDKGKGTGLGLSIVHGIVKNHRGFIDVDSHVGKGTTFTMFLPVIAAQLDEPSDRDQTPADTVHQGTILLVDDEAIIREMFSEYLEVAGFQVLIATDGFEALELFQAHAGAIDLVITDLGMPRMGGEELFRRLQKIEPSVKAIASSGYLDRTTKNDLRKMGFRDILTKPYRMQEIVSVIQGILRHTVAS